MNIWMQEYTDVCSCIFVVDFSLLNTGEFLNREMNLCEIKTTCYASGAVEGL